MKAAYENVTEEECRAIKFRCGNCGFACSAAVMPWSPVLAKVLCRHCDYVNTVKTRESFEESIADHVGEGKDRNKVATRKSVTVKTAMGDAYLIN